MRTPFLDRLHSGRVLLMDGAMGTELQRAGMPQGDCHEQWNLTRPDRVAAIHHAHVQAGADVLLTNTFQANPRALQKHCLASQLEAISHVGINLARDRAGSQRFTIGDIGPWGRSYPAFLRMIRALVSTDAVLLETLDDPLPSGCMIERARQHRANEPLLALVSCTYHHASGKGLRTITGLGPEAVARRAAKHGFQALGVNCGRDITMDDCIEIIRRYRKVTDLPLFARPNAGTPTQVDGQWVYPHTPEMMAGKLPELLEAGVAMVGGCCGTTPAHIAAFRPIVDRFNAQKK
jgi:5-methyltetrahydrofolate--homocysteine methyltransferase